MKHYRNRASWLHRRALAATSFDAAGWRRMARIDDHIKLLRYHDGGHRCQETHPRNRPPRALLMCAAGLSAL
jgi:hypothetical protein